MQGDFVVHTMKLRELSDRYDEKYRITNVLITSLQRAQAMAPPEQYGVYKRLIQNCNELASFYTKMASAGRDICEGVEMRSQQIRQQLEDNVYDLKHLIG